MLVRPFPRRTLLKSTFAAAAALALSPLAKAAGAPGLIQLQGPLGLITDAGGTNVLALATQAGLVLVDSGTPGNSDVLMDHVRALAPDGNITLFNTHWHDEQTGGNEALGNASATIIAHEKTRLYLSTDYYLPKEERYKPALPEAAHPTEAFFTTGSLTAGAETIDYGYLQQAHTNGDIYIFFRDTNVLAVGDVASPTLDPSLDWFGGGWLGGRVDAMNLLLELSNDATKIVPAVGPVMSRAQLQAERDMMSFLYDKLAEQIRMGFTAKDSLDSGIMEGLLRTFADPYQFLYDAHKGLWAHHNKIAPNIV